jgi:cytochrome c-type biogenesis protein CcsB
MDIIIILTVLFYLLSAAGYIAYLFGQKDYMQKCGFFFMAAGFSLNCMIICLGYIKSGHIPVRSFQETLFLTGWSASGVFIILRYKLNLKILGVYAAPLIASTLIAAALMPGNVGDVKNLSNNFWLICHIIVILCGDTLLAMACGAGILYLIQEHGIKAKKRGFFFKRLPSLELLDSAGYTCIISGFTLITIGLVTGLIYAKMVWGRFWSWDHKEVWSLITWLLYAALLHERLAAGWRGRKAAIMAIIGFAAVLFTFFGVNFILGGHHEEFTRW